jgi:hypothetical protein
MIYWTAEGVHTCDVNRPLSQVVWTIYKFYKKGYLIITLLWV